MKKQEAGAEHGKMEGIIRREDKTNGRGVLCLGGQNKIEII